MDVQIYGGFNGSRRTDGWHVSVTRLLYEMMRECFPESTFPFPRLLQETLCWGLSCWRWCRSVWTGWPSPCSPPWRHLRAGCCSSSMPTASTWWVPGNTAHTQWSHGPLQLQYCWDVRHEPGRKNSPSHRKEGREAETYALMRSKAHSSLYILHLHGLDMPTWWGYKKRQASLDLAEKGPMIKKVLIL